MVSYTYSLPYEDETEGKFNRFLTGNPLFHERFMLPAALRLPEIFLEHDQEGEHFKSPQEHGQAEDGL